MTTFFFLILTEEFSFDKNILNSATLFFPGVWQYYWIFEPCGLPVNPEAQAPNNPTQICHAVSNYTFDKSKQCIGSMTVEIDFLQKKNADSNPYDSDVMANDFIQQFNHQAFTTGQQVADAHAFSQIYPTPFCVSVIFADGV